MEPRHRNVAITGASSGIGAALARHYAKEGCRLFLAARNVAKLQQIADECTALGGAVETRSVDVGQTDDVQMWFDDITSKGSLELVYVNAGVTGGADQDRQIEPVKDVANLIQTNFIGATNTIGAAVDAMKSQKGGQIVVTNSLAGYVGFPGSPAYSGSKAGLRIYVESLQRLLKKDNIHFTLAFPGYVESPMSRKVVSAKPFKKSAEEAVKIIVHAVNLKKKKVGFPYVLWVGVRILGVLPLFLQNWFIPFFDLQVDMSKE